METYLVGGAVRDDLLGIPNTEKDWVVVGATPNDMLARGFISVGKNFPVFINPANGEEYALARIEKKTAPGYHGFEFNTSPEVTLEEDLKRRDLTINAIARDKTGNLIDPWGGVKDIERKKLCHVSAAFNEDPVRILRVARFRSAFHHLGFTIHSETLELLKQMVAKGEADYLVAERVWLEAYKTLKGKHPAIFFNILHQVKLLDKTFPELFFIAQSQDNDFAKCLNRNSEKHSPQILFALLAYIAALNNQSLKPLCQRLKLPHEYAHTAVLAERNSKDLVPTQKYTAEKLLSIIQASDGLRKTEAFNDFLKAASLYDSTLKNNILRLTNGIEVLKSIDFKTLLEDSSEDEELPARIKKIRLSALKDI